MTHVVRFVLLRKYRSHYTFDACRSNDALSVSHLTLYFCIVRLVSLLPLHIVLRVAPPNLAKQIQEELRVGGTNIVQT